MQVQKKFATAVLVTLTYSAMYSQQPPPPRNEIKLASMSGGKVICQGTAPQFLDSDTLVALV